MGRTTENETREERVQAMTEALLDESPLSEEEIEAAFEDVTPAREASIHLRPESSPKWRAAVPDAADPDEAGSRL